VALKRIRPDKLHPAARRRFLREAALTARLEHPGIVPIYGLGEDDAGPFYTMPFIRGRTLQEAIEEFHRDESLRRDPGRRSLRFRELLQQFVAACNTVAYAHDQGVVHRDLKPSNLMLGPYGETLVLDWGLAKRLGDDGGAAEAEAEGVASAPGPWSEAVTATGEVLGTPQYMSPEQARGEPAGPAGDIFCLGLVLYAILMGRSAFEAASFRGGDPLQAVREAAIVPPRAGSASAPRVGGDLPKGACGAGGGPLCHGAGAGRGCDALAGRRAGECLAGAGVDAGAAVGAAAPHGGGGGGGGAGGGRWRLCLARAAAGGAGRAVRPCARRGDGAA
jgi:tRNA A-37 threonylcarbamoyl transferase component Bud32